MRILLLPLLQMNKLRLEKPAPPPDELAGGWHPALPTFWVMTPILGSQGAGGGRGPVRTTSRGECGLARRVAKGGALTPGHRGDAGPQKMSPVQPQTTLLCGIK